MAKAVGYEIVEFCQKGWPEGYFSDESILTATDDGKIVRSNGNDNDPSLPLTDLFDLSDFGAIISETTDDSHGFAYFFNKWKKAKTTITLVIQYDKERDSLIRAALEMNKVKVVG